MTYHFSRRFLFYVIMTNKFSAVYPLYLAFPLNVTLSHTLITVLTLISLVKVVLIMSRIVE